MQALEVVGREVGALLRDPVESPHEAARYAFGPRVGQTVACESVERIPVQNKTVITVAAIVALVAISVAVLTLFIY